MMQAIGRRHVGAFKTFGNDRFRREIEALIVPQHGGPIAREAKAID